MPKSPRSDSSIWLVPGLGLGDADAVVRRFSQPDAALAIKALHLANGSDLAGRLVARFEAGLPNPPTVVELAADFCMSHRTLSRHIKEATGRSRKRTPGQPRCATIKRG